MKNNMHTINPILVDILVPVAGAGGVENVINAVGKYLNHNGFHVRIVQLLSDGNRWFDPELEVYPILIGKKAPTLDFLSELYANFLSQYGVPNIVIATTWPYLVMTAKKALAASTVPCKIVSWLHGPLYEYDRYGAGGIECLRHADAHLCISQKAADIILADNPAARVYVAHNPVFTEKYTHQAEYHKAERTLQFVGRLSAEKHVETIIQAIGIVNEDHPDLPWKLRIIGTGEELDKLKQLTNELQLDDFVSFPGWQSSPWSDCSNVTASVLSSEYEGSPLCAIESLANGIPVLSTPVDGITELITPGQNGWLYPIRDSDALARILGWISDNTLPDIAPQKCIDSIHSYKSDIALATFKDALIDVLDTISIIIPCHDVEKYLKRCLDSILSQTITGVKFEIICVDDCSNDNTLSILEEYEHQYPDMFIIIPLEQNMKQGYARNLALTYSTGDYITYVDSDDCIDANMLEQLYRYAKLDDCDITECGYTLFYDRDGVPNATASGKLTLLHMNNPDDKRYYILNRYWKTSPWGRLYKRSFLVDNNIRFPENIFMEDILFSTECMYHMRSYLLLPANYYFYYGNDNGTMLSDKLKDYYMNTMTMQNMSTDFLKEHDWYSDCYDEYAFMHYKKAFEELLWRMSLHPELYSYENIQLAKNELLTRFPDITNNHFIISSDSNITHICRNILTHNIPSDDLKKVFVQNG